MTRLRVSQIHIPGKCVFQVLSAESQMPHDLARRATLIMREINDNPNAPQHETTGDWIYNYIVVIFD